MLPPNAPCASFAFLSILAEFPGTEDYPKIGWTVVMLAAAIGAANFTVDLWIKMFPKDNPPLSVIYATKQELVMVEKVLTEDLINLEAAHLAGAKRVESRFEHWIESIEKMREDRAKTTDESFSEIQRALGRLEGKIDSLKKS